MLAPNQGKFKQSDDASTAALRLQLQKELQNKKQCSYQPYECTQLTHDRYNYCLHHILSDKSAPFKQCSFLYSNGKRCYLPAPKADNKKEFGGYCNEHALKTHLQRSKAASKQPPPRTAEVLLHSLSHYVKRTRTRTVSVTSEDGGRSTPDHPESKVTKSYDPFVDINAVEVNASCSDILDLCSESESDVEASTFSSVWQDAHADSSDNESIDSENGDPLKHANVYTAEEITSITKDKLVRLQSLYMEQFHHLHHILKERRRKYIHALKREKETCCSISNQLRDNPKEQRMYKKLKAYNRYHKRYGVDAILAKREHELRMKVTEGTVYKPHTFAKCAFTEGGVKCLERALPVARHCRKHILEDSNQVLFRICGKMCADIECPTPVEAIFDESTCHLHRDIPILRSYAQFRKDSESDYDDKDNTDSGILPQNDNVQTEYITQTKTEHNTYNKSEYINNQNQNLTTFNNSDIVETTEELLKTEIVDDIEMPLVLDLPVSDFPDVPCEIEDTIVEVGEFAENFENSSSIADSLEKNELVIEEDLNNMDVSQEEKMYEDAEKVQEEPEKVEETGKLQEESEKIQEEMEIENGKPEKLKEMGEIDVKQDNNDLK